ncbi:hypothetical protein QJS10_CPA03g01342 [Acorus calamus]|uniref:Reverse transcriptase zinc-binding domain-containing protein n=1 Tax=Acorus calamus TaxID=4465 RepID=A0AAV9F733_ACOCL|nr:hypothetical protein QJS10_CPA03g01342 [Acorus calamus]
MLSLLKKELREGHLSFDGSPYVVPFNRATHWSWEDLMSTIPRIKELYIVMRLTLPGSDSRFWKFVWRLPILPRMKTFLWKLIWNRLPTRTLLSSRGVYIELACPICVEADETAQHLFMEFLQQSVGADGSSDIYSRAVGAAFVICQNDPLKIVAVGFAAWPWASPLCMGEAEAINMSM